MIQVVALNYILNNKDTELLSQYGEEYYFKYTKEYNFIKKHYAKYGVIPDGSTVVDTFADFDLVNTADESKEYIFDKLYQEKITKDSQDIVDDVSNLFATDPVLALQTLKSKLNAIPPQPNTEFGVDIIQTAPDRYEQLVQMMENQAEYWFSTGLPELDLALNGGIRRGEELIIIFARTNNLKSWIAEKIAVAVWDAGYNVGFFSPEMSPDSVGRRFDTLYEHFDNKGLQGAKEDFDLPKYRSYCHRIKKNKAKFNVTTPAHFNNQVTVTAIRNWIVTLDLKLVVIDGVKYMRNERCPSGRQSTTDRLTEISEDLMALSVELGVPIIIVVQANREAARDKEGDVANNAPELDTIRDSDGIAHNASVILSLIHKNTEKDGHTITAYIPKNRRGEVGQKLIWKIDINVGQFTYVPNPKDGLGINPEKTPVAMPEGTETSSGEGSTNMDYSDLEDM